MCEEWQPIETAPRGVRILLCDDGIVFLGLWDDSLWGYLGNPYGWREDGYSADGSYQSLSPTHWMPLPHVPEVLG